MATKTKDAELEAMLAEGPQDPVDFEREDTTEDEEQFDFSTSGDIKDGQYHARVQAFSRGVSQSGNPKYDVKYFLPQIGRSLDGTLSLTPAAAWKTGAALRALGVTPCEDGKMGSFLKSELVGRYCIVDIKSEPFEGRMVPKIMNVLPPTVETQKIFEELT